MAKKNESAISITFDFDEARKLLNRLPGQLDEALEGFLNDASALLLRELTTYPVQRPNTPYVRTNTLARSWSRRFEGSGDERRAVIGSNANMAPYNRYVQDRTRQPAYFAANWRDHSAQAIAENQERAVQEMWQRRIESALR